jgi:hypothetical protein
MLSWKDQVLSKGCEYKVFLKWVAKSTIVANFHTWSFFVEMLQRVNTIIINVMQGCGIAWYGSLAWNEAEGQAK